MTRTNKYTVHAVIEGMGIEMSIPVLNPGNHNWGRRVYLIDVGIGYSSYPFLVEAQHGSDTFDIFSESDEGYRIRVDPSDIPNNEEDILELGYHWDGNGQPYSLDDVALREVAASSVRYFADHLPKGGCSVADYTDDGKQAFKRIAYGWCVDAFAEENNKEPHNRTDLYSLATDAIALFAINGRHHQSWEELEQWETACHALADRLIDEGKEDELSDVIKGLRLIAEDE